MTAFALADDNTFVNRRWGKELFGTLAWFGVSWFTETDVSIGDDEELFDLLAESGGRQILCRPRISARGDDLAAVDPRALNEDGTAAPPVRSNDRPRAIRGRTMNRDRHRVLRLLLYVFLALTCARVWLGPFSIEREASAQLPNAGARLADLVAESKNTNQILAEIRDHLKTGVTKVEEQEKGEKAR